MLGRRRRTHQKSRAGCMTCKRKKIKCDEQQPSCQHCTDRSVQCNYPVSVPVQTSTTASTIASEIALTPRSPSTSTSASVPLISFSAPSSSTPPLDSALTPASRSGSLPPERFSASLQQELRTFNRATTYSPAVPTPLTSTFSLFHNSTDLQWKLSDLELLHFYTSSTSLTFSNNPARSHVWQYIIPQIAFSNDFLLRGILAISALHLSRVVPERKDALSAIASGHLNSALAGFRFAMESVSSQNCQACSVFGTILVVYELGLNTQTSCLFFSTATNPPSSGNIECIQLLRGSAHIITSHYETLTQGPLGPILTWDNLSEEEGESNPVDPAKFSALSKLWDPADVSVSAAEVEALNEALRWLKLMYSIMVTFGNTDATSAALTWPVQVPELYLLMVENRQPVALVVLAHFCLLLNRVDDFWWIGDLSRRLLKEIDRLLGKQWEKWISWPLQDLVLSEFRNSCSSGS